MERLVIGLMSGTSIDGIDAALVRITETQAPPFVLEEFISIPYSEKEREAILLLCDPKRSTVEKICSMNFKLGHLFAEAVLRLLEKAQVDPKDVACIGSHGQTIYHIPGDSTLQIGEPAVISNVTGIITVADFRTADVAVGGQGAPLVPYFDEIVFGQDPLTSAVQNIGGIGNVTIVGGGAEQVPWIAFDTGPGNMIMDYFAEQASDGRLTYDKDGKIAAAGQVNEQVLQRLMEHPYFNEQPPKSTGRELFGTDFSKQLLTEHSLSLEDWAATATAFTAASIADQYRRFILPYTSIDRIIVGGGGSKNPTLLQMIRERTNLPVFVHEDFGISSDAKEAIAFALLADAAIHRRINNVPRATGAERGVILGKIVYP